MPENKKALEGPNSQETPKGDISSPRNGVTSSPPPAKKKRGRFKKGESGNPAGRPKGAKNKSTEIKAMIEASLVEEAQDSALAVLRKTIELAKKGDTTCIKILMDRFWPTTIPSRKNADNSGIGGINIIVQQMPEIEVIEGDRVDES